MIHIQKYTRNQVGHILQHDAPTRARAERKNVNPALTKNNYNFVKGCGIDNLRKIINQKNLRVSPRKDVNILCSCIVTAPKNLPPDREKEFFYKTALFLQNRYGHCVSAWVHNDEPNSRPHLHFCFVPIVIAKNNQLKVCAKELINKKDLTTLHGDFEKYICKEMGLKLEIINGATANGNKTVAELKKQTLEKEIVRLQKLKFKVQNTIEREISR